MTEFLVVGRPDGETVYATDAGEGFTMLDCRGRPVRSGLTYREATEGWVRLRLRQNLADALSESGGCACCPRCGREPSSGTSPEDGMYRIGCWKCGKIISGVSAEDARMRWNALPRHRFSQEYREETP